MRSAWPSFAQPQPPQPPRFQTTPAGFALAALFALCLAGCTARPPAGPAAYRAVFIAGDSSLPVFDNAAENLRTTLDSRGLTAPETDTLFPALHPGSGAKAALAPILRRIAGLRPNPGQGCIVFATSHGAKGRGLLLSGGPTFLTPADLDFALTLGCREAPTVIIVSGCFSGQFARSPLTAPNRIILTAARADRTSFGCGAGRDFTVFDQCLIGAMQSAPGWRQLFLATSACVSESEREGHLRPSQPQFSAGAATLPESLAPALAAPRV